MMLHSISDSILSHLVILYAVLNHFKHTSGCEHRDPTPTEISRVFIESATERIKRDVTQAHEQLRIHLTYDSSVHNLPSDNQRLIKDRVMSEAIQFWENALETRRLTAPIKLARACAEDQRFRKADADEADEISNRQHYCVHSCSEQTRCGDIVVPDSHLQGCRIFDPSLNVYREESSTSSGVDADFLLYVAASNTTRCDASVAYATYCQLEVEFDRPIAGFINVCPDAISTHEADLELAVATIKHEILHALGFSLSLYGFYRDSDGNPLTPRHQPGNRPALGPDSNFVFSDRVVKSIRRPTWGTVDGPVDWLVNIMVTPKVTAEVRRHFNCSTLEGAELENQGPPGTRLTHWEKRLFENELMTGIYTQNPVVSRITLALMEDTGWYIANYSFTGPLEWGSNLGCDFAKKSCFDWITSKKSSNESTHPYCTEMRSPSLLKTECTTMRKSISLCNMHEYSEDIDVDYRYSADSPRLGGIVSLADYCPYLQEFSWKKNGEFVRGSGCTLPSNIPDADINFAAEYYGADSRCFDLPQPFTISECGETFTSNNYGSGCYQYACTSTQGLVVYVNGESHQCYKAGQKLEIRTVMKTAYHQGTIICPACTEICNGTVMTCPADSEPPPIQDDSSLVESDIPCAGSTVRSSYFRWLMTLLPLCWYS